WKGPTSQRGRYRHRAEAETRVATPDSVVTILEQLGYAVSVRIDRRVEVYRLGQALLRLEWYPAMDVLLEVEGEPPEIERAIAATGLARDRFLPESLPYFVAQNEPRTGRAALTAPCARPGRSRCRCASPSPRRRSAASSCPVAWR